MTYLQRLLVTFSFLAVLGVAIIIVAPTLIGLSLFLLYEFWCAISGGYLISKAALPTMEKKGKA